MDFVLRVNKDGRESKDSSSFSFQKNMFLQTFFFK